APPHIHHLHSFPTRRSSDLQRYRFLRGKRRRRRLCRLQWHEPGAVWAIDGTWLPWPVEGAGRQALVIVDLGARAVLACRSIPGRSEEHTSELQSRENLVCRL